MPSSSDGGSLGFKLAVNNPEEQQSFKMLFLAASAEDKAAWTSDISQVIISSVLNCSLLNEVC